MRIGQVIDNYELIQNIADIIWKVKKDDTLYIMKLFYKNTYDLYSCEVQFNTFIVQRGSYKKYYYAIMTLFPATLYSFIKDIHSLDIQDLELVLSTAGKMVHALRTLHDRKIMHRDIKPENIVLTKSFDEIISGSDFDIHFIDYELAQPFNSGCLTPMIGTLCFASPDILTGKKYDYNIDVWSLGCCLYELFMGESLFRGENLEHILDSIERVTGPVFAPNRTSCIQKKDNYILRKLQKRWSKKDSQILSNMVESLLTKKEQ